MEIQPPTCLGMAAPKPPADRAPVHMNRARHLFKDPWCENVLKRLMCKKNSCDVDAVLVLKTCSWGFFFFVWPKEKWSFSVTYKANELRKTRERKNPWLLAATAGRHATSQHATSATPATLSETPPLTRVTVCLNCCLLVDGSGRASGFTRSLSHPRSSC